MMYYLIISLIILVLVTVKYPDRYIGTHSRKDLPGPKGVPIFGNFFQIIPHTKRMIIWMDTMSTLYGLLYTFTMPVWGRCIVVNHPGWLEHIRKKDTVVYTKGEATLAIFSEFPGPMSPFATDGSAWRMRRKLISPIFSTKNFNEQVSQAMHEIIPVAIDMLTSAAAEKVQFDWNNFSGRLAIAVLHRMVFGLDSKSVTRDPSCLNEPDILVGAMSECNTISSGRLYNPIWRLTDKLTGTGRRFATARTELWKIADSVISDRRVQDKSANDNPDHTPKESDFLTAMIDSGLTDTEIRGAIITIFFAGHDNFLNILGWSLYELSKATVWLDRMREEAIENNEPGDVLEYGNISKYPIHLAVFYETLRLWPGVPKNARYAEEDDVLPGIPEAGLREVNVHRGDYVLWSDRCMMRSEHVWGADAAIFNPARHLDAQQQFVRPTAPKFHAFGAGPRLCPGAQLGTYEFISVWAALLPTLNIIPLEIVERSMKDSFTSTMDGEFLVEIRRVEESKKVG